MKYHSLLIDGLYELYDFFFVHVLYLLLFHAYVIIVDVIDTWEDFVHVSDNPNVQVCLYVVVWIVL